MDESPEKKLCLRFETRISCIQHPKNFFICKRNKNVCFDVTSLAMGKSYLIASLGGFSIAVRKVLNLWRSASELEQFAFTMGNMRLLFPLISRTRGCGLSSGQH